MRSPSGWWATQGHPQPPALSFVGGWPRRPPSRCGACRDAAGFAAAVAITFLAFFAFNKQAFCNYYFFVDRRALRHARGLPMPNEATRRSASQS